MKGKNCRIIITVIVIIGIVFSTLTIQSRTDGTYYNAVVVPTDADSLYVQEIKSDVAAVAIQVSNFSEGRYKLTLNLSNSSKVQYEYKVTLTGYSGSLICDTSNTEISYGEDYSSGNRNNARTVYYFVPDRKNSEITNIGEGMIQHLMWVLRKSRLLYILRTRTGEFQRSRSNYALVLFREIQTHFTTLIVKKIIKLSSDGEYSR